MESTLGPVPSKNGLSLGMVPSLLMRWILPRGLLSDWATAASKCSPVVR
jgi:hypothetical protein